MPGSLAQVLTDMQSMEAALLPEGVAANKYFSSPNDSTAAGFTNASLTLASSVLTFASDVINYEKSTGAGSLALGASGILAIYAGGNALLSDLNDAEPYICSKMRRHDTHCSCKMRM